MRKQTTLCAVFALLVMPSLAAAAVSAAPQTNAAAEPAVLASAPQTEAAAPAASAPAVGEVTYEEQSSPEPGEEHTVGAVKKSALVARVDLQLNDTILHSTVLDYALPQPLQAVAEKCAEGDNDECYFSYKAFENAEDPAVAAQANLELSVLSLQRGLVKQALSYIDKAARLAPEDPFIELTRGWTLFAAGKYKQARKSFADMLYLTADFEYASSAKLGTALAYYFEGDKAQASSDFQYIYTSNPYLISFAAYMMGQVAASRKDSRKLAPVFLQQALSHDGHNYPAMQLLAQLSEKDKENKTASFQYYSTLFSLDPTNEKAGKKVAQYAEDLQADPAAYLFYLRLDQPIVQELASVPSEKIKMALYADRWQQPVALKRVTLMASGVMSVWDERLGEVLKSPSYVTRVLEFNEQTKGIDFKDARGHVEFSARRPFVIRPVKEEKTLLVKDAAAADLFAADFSDKELKGDLLVLPVAEGMLLVNEVMAEDLIPALLATQAREIKEPAALQALAVVFRAALQEAAQQNADQPYHITDNDVYFKFKGINLTVQPMLEAVKSSRGLELSNTNLGYYASCGPVSYDNVGNTENRPNYTYSPANLSKYMLSNPPADLYSTPQDPTQWSAVKWVYLYDGAEIAARVNARAEIGSLRALVPQKLSPQGRVLSMRFEGSKGSYLAQTPQEVAYLLSAGTMPSTFFDMVPMYKGKNIQRVLVRGYDSGTGVGLCVAGAEGLAGDGSDYQGIIKYYFPNARILDTQTGELH